ncbi:hypothetical protein [Dapis sp. BLCC M172]|uniref:hypothetical protein n=1 Tax=Dapis sp. BLCC M172 TaxID=2975281 RepID=UPI003CEEEC50
MLANYQNSSFSEIQESSLFSFTKLSLVYQYLPETFHKIKDIFMEIFETVEDIKIESLLNFNDKIYEPLI